MIKEIPGNPLAYLQRSSATQKSSVIERLIGKVEDNQKGSQEDPDIKIRIGERDKDRSDHSYGDVARRVRRKQVKRGGGPEVEQVRPLPQDPPSENVRVRGKWGNGHLKTDTGMTGTYEFLKNGLIGFSLGPVKGYVLSDSTGVIYNPKTKQTYKFDLELEGHTFKMKNVEEFKLEDAADDDVRAHIVRRALSVEKDTGTESSDIDHQKKMMG